MRLILDSSAVIGLSHLGLLDKVAEIFEIYVAEGVYEEVCKKGFCRVGSHELQKLINNEKIKTLKLGDENKVKLLIDTLGRGEAETIVIALENQLIAVLDDRIARRKAENAGIKFFGTLRVLRHLYDKDIISKDELIKLLEKLRNLGFRISDNVIEKLFQDL